MKQYDKEIETYWEITFQDTKGNLIDFFGNTENEKDLDFLKQKAIKKGYDQIDIIKVTRETTRFKK